MRYGMRCAAGLLLLCAAGGCGSHTAAQVDLVKQAQRGIVLTEQALDQQRAMIDELHALRRVRLDEAFDADVHERAALDAEWVIEHRRAYAATIDLLWSARQAADEADRVARENLRAMDEALQRLGRMVRRPMGDEEASWNQSN